MSYNHEPQFTSQSATVQDVSDYLSFKREWLLYIEGYSDTFPDTSDYLDRCYVFNQAMMGSSRIDRMLSSELLTHAVALLDIPWPTYYQEIEILGLTALSMRYRTLLLHRYSPLRQETTTICFDTTILGDIYEELRSESSHVIRCDCCEEHFLSDYINYINDEPICDSCREDSYNYSSYLEEYVHNDNVVHAIDAYGDEIVLDDSNIPHNFSYNDDTERYEHDDYEDKSNWIIGDYHEHRHSYSIVPSTWSRRNKRVFGVELEVEVNNGAERNKKALEIRDYVTEVQEADYNLHTSNPLVFERDGSLDNGFEIISQPMGLDNHRNLWLWTTQTTITRNLRSHLTGTCGLHVHVNRDTLTNLQIARAVYFVNHQANKHLIETIARRYNAGYCKAKSKKISTANRPEDRYEMINLQNSKTIEFRIFKGSLKYEAIIAAIEFCHAVLNFAATNSNLHLSTEAFLKFIFEHQNRPDTAVLRQYLMERNPSFRTDFERLIKPEMKKLIPKPELTLSSNIAETAEV